eukprot:gene456-546_t
MKLTFNEASMFLPLFEIKNITQTITRLEQNVEEAKNKYLPKTKFSFAKKTTTKPLSAPIPTATTTTTTTATTDISSLPQLVLNTDTQELPQHKSTITINKTFTSLKIDHLTSGTVLCLRYIDGSVFVDSCRDATFVVSSRQIRIHDCYNCQFYVYTKSHPIVEGCSGIGFAPYPPKMMEQIDDVAVMDDYPSNQCWMQVNDFDWLQSKQSPNWHTIGESDRKESWCNSSSKDDFC